MKGSAGTGDPASSETSVRTPGSRSPVPSIREKRGAVGADPPLGLDLEAGALAGGAGASPALAGGAGASPALADGSLARPPSSATSRGASAGEATGMAARPT